MVTKIQLIDRVDKNKLMEFTENISKEVRLSGTEEEYRAFQYAEQQLKEFGFETSLYKRMAYISHPGETSLRVNGTPYQSITHAMAASTPEEGLHTDLVYVGDGSEGNWADVKGKAVVIDGLAIPGAVKAAEQAGAIAAVFISAEYRHEMIVSTVWGNPSINQVNDYPTIAVLSVNFDDGQKIKEMILNSGETACEIKAVVHKFWGEIPTLIAEYKADEPTDEFVLFSGHIDSWHHGAMDNGTANATMLEIARIIGEQKPTFRRSLRFAFWSGHSHGRYAGSTLYADENWEELHDNCVMHVNIDSVGAKESVVLSEGNAMAETKSVAAKAIKEIAGETYNSSRFGRAGDQSFWGPGVPSLLMGLSEQKPMNTPAMEAFSKLFGDGKGGGFGWWWHTTEDTLDKISPEFLQRDCKIYLSILWDLCTSRLLEVNQLNAIKEINSYLDQYHEAMPNHKGLAETKKRVEGLKELIRQVEDIVKTAENLTDCQAEEYNRWNIRVSKGLVRLNYVNEDEFNHDSALAQPPLPLLAVALKFKSVNSDMARFAIENTLTRNTNKFNFILRGLICSTEEYLGRIKEVKSKVSSI
ncbi:M28 family metallopeptidase [Sporosarcina koreensis]|uniref:M28 family metallopeptidase n=1 Tax=Sporosarcina koreensis TaxID=334735 RepID=A0ABW0U2I1_9BACL